MSSGRQRRFWLAPSSAWCLRFLPAVLISLLLASEAARSQTTFGPGVVPNTINTVGVNVTVVGSTDLRPPAGSVAVNIGGNGNVTFDPNAPPTGPITVVTQNAKGIIVTGNGDLRINPFGSPFLTSITTTGANASAISVESANHLTSLDNVRIITLGGPASDGIRIQNPNNTVNAAGVTVITEGTGSSALAIISGGGVTANFTDSSLASDGGPAIIVNGGGIKNINLTDTSVAAGADGRWLFVTGGSDATNVIATRAALTGAAITAAGSISDVRLLGGTTWRMTGDSNVTRLLNSESSILFSPPVNGVFKTLTTVNYTGAAGRIGLNTFLGTDSSPSDKLVINGGNAIGNTRLRIVNAGGPGADTLGNGILVVQALGNGTTDPGAFTLAGEVRAGFHDYRLFRSGFNGTNPEDWFLRSTFNGGNGGNGVLPPDPAPDNGGPIIGPEIATYGVVQPAARQLGLTTLGTLHERVGDTAADPCCCTTPPDAIMTKAPVVSDGGCRPSIWGRAFGQSVNDRYQAFADPRASGQVLGLQSGLDIWRGSLLPGHRDSAGVYLAYGNSRLDVDGLITNAAATAYVLTRTGTVNLNAFSGGAYWTHYGPAGWYIDAVVQGTVYDGDATTQFAHLPLTGSGITASLEAGYPIALPWFGPRFVLEPQAQIIWQRVDFNDANDGLGPVDLGSTSGATGRLGLRGQWTILGPNGQVWQPYVRANVWRDFGAEATTAFGVELVQLVEEATRVEFAAGLTAKLDRNWSLYGQAGYQFATDDGIRRDSFRGDFGVRYRW